MTCTFLIHFVIFCDEKLNDLHYSLTKHNFVKSFMLPFSVLKKHNVRQFILGVDSLDAIIIIYLVTVNSPYLFI